MRIPAGPLLDFLNSTTQFLMVDLYTFALRNGVVLRYCTASTAITYNGVTYSPAPAGLKRGKIRWTTGIEVDTLDIEFPADASVMVGTVSILSAAVKGLFDNARVTLLRLYLSDWSTPVGSVLLFQGNAAPSDITRTVMRMTVKSDLERLNVPIPDLVYEATCSNTVYDVKCGVNAATYTVLGAVASVNASGGIVTSLGQPDAYFQMGSIRFTTGQNAGSARAVKSYAGGVVTLAQQFPFPIAAGDSFSIRPGCDKIQNGDCLNKFNNVVRFLGAPFIPVPETAI